MKLAREHLELIPKINISIPEELAKFKEWQEKDGTIEGLRKLYKDQQETGLDDQANPPG